MILRNTYNRFFILLAFLLSIFLICYFLLNYRFENSPTTNFTKELHQIINNIEPWECTRSNNEKKDCNLSSIIESNNQLLTNTAKVYIPLGISKTEAEKLLNNSGFELTEYKNNNEIIVVADRISSQSLIPFFCCVFKFRSIILVENNKVKSVNVIHYGA